MANTPEEQLLHDIFGNAHEKPTPIGQLMGNTAFPRTERRKKFLHTVFTDTIETGINNWAIAEVYHWQHADVMHTAEDPATPNPKAGEDDLDGFFATIVPNNDESIGWHEELPDIYPIKTPFIEINIDTIELGIMRFWEYCMGERDSLGHPADSPNCNQDDLGGVPPDSYDSRVQNKTAAKPTHNGFAAHLSPYYRQFLVMDLTNGEDGDYDANVLDIIVQLGLFNEVVYA